MKLFSRNLFEKFSSIAFDRIEVLPMRLALFSFVCQTYTNLNENQPINASNIIIKIIIIQSNAYSR
jgi:hypothetical protein